jgi:K+-sensing histidine kinase KdpD
LDLTQLRNPDFWKDYYQNVQKQIEKITNMLRDLWTVSEERKFEFNDAIQLRGFVDKLSTDLKELLASKKITIENTIAEELPILKVDKPKFTRLFELLLKDEIVSLPSGSKIWVSACVPLDAPTEIQIQVRDNGPGLPKEALRLIFDPFVVRADSPMEYGINLMACYFIVHHHGGKIDAVSAEGNGTTFNLRLLQDPNSAPVPAPEGTEFLQKVLMNDSVWNKMLRAA